MAVSELAVQDTTTLEMRLQQLEERVVELEENIPEDKVTIVMFSGELDRVLAGFIIATGALAMGYEVSMFFTFWGLNAVRDNRTLEGKNIMERMMSLMTPGSTEGMGLSNMNFFGAGARMMRLMMKQKNVENIEDLINMTKDMGARFVSCGMSQMVMGINTSELRDDMEDGGVAAYLGDAVSSKVTLFI
ncbi:MAG: DsrE/DsrF/DrsH-like family protein [Anaerolineae bacterium]|nr:DsrE/DsrF/DrsH-like family protein [Anaerolineae bacterium]MDQ7035197.1 DsrE/DsrF/DrsH-like family protein [Anaerolineae bacterium]